MACAMLLPKHGKLILFSNNGSLYVGYEDNDIYFASERFALDQIACKNIHQIKDQSLILNIPTSHIDFKITDEKNRNEKSHPRFSN